MAKSQDRLQKTVKNLPNAPGVYKFLGKNNQILYIGKATSLKSRVKSYFAKDLSEKRSPLIEKMVQEAVSLEYEKTNSVLEALILEARLIKQHTPPYNTADKDQKSFNYVVITKEKFPRVLVVRERDIFTDSRFQILDSKFGPFPHNKELKEALKIVRKIFPFRDKCVPFVPPLSCT
jgi:excinuclease ABC subunit C